MRGTIKQGQKFDALLEMIVDNGASTAGQLPPVDYLESLEELDGARAQDVAQAHRDGASPPDPGGGGA